MRRAFDLDVLACRRCGGRLRLIATVEDPEAIRAILAALAGSREREWRAPPGAAGEPPRSAVELGAWRHPDAAVAEVWSLASWAGISLWTGALFWQRIRDTLVVRAVPGAGAAGEAGSGRVEHERSVNSGTHRPP